MRPLFKRLNAYCVSSSRPQPSNNNNYDENRPPVPLSEIDIIDARNKHRNSSSSHQLKNFFTPAAQPLLRIQVPKSDADLVGEFGEYPQIIDARSDGGGKEEKQKWRRPKK